MKLFPICSVGCPAKAASGTGAIAVYIYLEKPRIHAHDYDERQHCYEKAPDQRHRPQRDTFEKATVFYR